MKRVTAVERVQRILTILPWIVDNQGCHVDEVCERFGISRSDLITDLDFVFVHVGLHPFTPDMLSDVSIEDDRINVHLGDYFHRPLRLTSLEALILLTAASGNVPYASGDDVGRATLASAVEKLSTALGAGAEDTFDVRLGAADQGMLDTFRQAAEEHRSVLIGYYTYGRDELSERLVDPHRVKSQGGFWYLSAWCHKAEALREFRVDRIYSAVPTEETFAAPSVPEETSWNLNNRLNTVAIVGNREIAWVAEMYPCDEVEELPNGQLRIVLPVTATRWLERLLLRLDPTTTATDVDTGEDLRPVAIEAARRMLGRYDTVTS
ncbi:MAG TPA: WYL domain-containing protein [Microthrixaceae bacterium]|nr:WYL domain-containing protein [Microthrixaceae bacterium]